MTDPNTPAGYPYPNSNPPSPNPEQTAAYPQAAPADGRTSVIPNPEQTAAYPQGTPVDARPSVIPHGESSGAYSGTQTTVMPGGAQSSSAQNGAQTSVMPGAGQSAGQSSPYAQGSGYPPAYAPQGGDPYSAQYGTAQGGYDPYAGGPYGGAGAPGAPGVPGAPMPGGPNDPNGKKSGNGMKIALGIVGAIAVIAIIFVILFATGTIGGSNSGSEPAGNSITIEPGTTEPSSGSSSSSPSSGSSSSSSSSTKPSSGSSSSSKASGMTAEDYLKASYPSGEITEEEDDYTMTMTASGNDILMTITYDKDEDLQASIASSVFDSDAFKQYMQECIDTFADQVADPSSLTLTLKVDNTAGKTAYSHTYTCSGADGSAE